jgi:hypothetical protein
MARRQTDMSGFVTALLPALSRSLAEQFNVFRVMHHGTHEKQLSNVFAWLLSVDGTHQLGEAFQRIFLERVNAELPAEARLPSCGYRVVQEVNTNGGEEIAGDDIGMDIADIVLSRDDAAVVIENYGTSDGHGHDYYRYLAHGAVAGRAAAVVLLCHRRQPHLQRDGWENAAVVTYAEVLSDLQAHLADNRSWCRRHPQQNFFIEQMVQHYVEGPAAVSIDDQVSFIKSMCETGESARYGYRPRDRAMQEFADLVAEHARRQFEESRQTLAAVKDGLRTFARSTLMKQVNEMLKDGRVVKVVTRFVGQWEWCVELQRADAHPTIFLEFGPTAVVENERVAEPLVAPDYARVFVTKRAAGGDNIGRIVQTDVGLVEVLSGLSPDDARLSNAVIAVAES